MQRAMARQAEAEREKRAKIIAAEGEALEDGEFGRASDVMMADPLALQMRNLQTMVEIGVDTNSTIMFPAPIMSTIQEIGAFLSRETDLVSAAKRASPEQRRQTAQRRHVGRLSGARRGVNHASTLRLKWSLRDRQTRVPAGSATAICRA